MRPGTGQFVGRQRQLALLERDLADVRATGRGRFVLVRGRRRIGKSRLVNEFLVRSRPPAVFYAATRGPMDRELARFSEAVGHSTLPAAAMVRDGTTFTGWQAALSAVAMVTGDDACVVVIDELPYLLGAHPEVEAEFQHAWDQVLENRPVLLIAIGSDLAMMEALTSYGRPLHGRATREIVLEPLTVAEVGDLLGLDPAAAVDATLIVGGFPLVAQTWPKGLDRREFLAEALTDPTSALIVTGERALAAEFPDVLARAVLQAVGAGQSTFAAIASRTGVPSTTLRRVLDSLLNKRVLAAEQPLSSRPAPKLTHIRVADPYLRFWLRFVEPGLDEVERGRGDLAAQRVDEGWAAYRGAAVEPLIRSSIDRMLPTMSLAGTRHVGSYWTRSHEVEVDVVGTPDLRPVTRVSLLGSIKWRENAAFDRADVAALHAARQRVPGANPETLLLAVSRTTVASLGVDITWGPADVVDAWRR